ncbi:MAG TPA: Maf family protein [Jatrophihabitans sp.]|uniref:Maf family protein n=1 Tax=Jatrophihabitans sp. TaxID=1932789 RepID=UPI002E0B1BFE|nr:Maf family protein [Jatrophihabitans sp.]
MRFVLASASPARLTTLRRAGLDPEVIVSGVDEDGVTAPTTGELVGRLADLKAQAVATTIAGAALVLGCDSLLELDGEPVGKPGTAQAAVERWRRLRGRSGVLHTGHRLIDTGAGTSTGHTAATVVHFADASDAEIERYCASGEPESVAGAFTIDGLGGWFIDRVDGDPHTVVGVSLPALRRMLHELGHQLVDLGYPAR